MSKIYNIHFWIENDAPPPFSENSSVLVPLPIPKESSQKTTPFLGILSLFLVSRTLDSRPPPTPTHPHSQYPKIIMGCQEWQCYGLSYQILENAKIYQKLLTIYLSHG